MIFADTVLQFEMWAHFFQFSSIQFSSNGQQETDAMPKYTLK